MYEVLKLGIIFSRVVTLYFLWLLIIQKIVGLILYAYKDVRKRAIT